MRPQPPTLHLTQPYVVIVCYNSSHTPVFAFTTFGIDTVDKTEVTVRGVTIPLKTNIENVVIEETKPANIGAGLIRRDVSFDIKNDGPFSTPPFAKELYSAGASTNSFYFGVWVTDYTKSLYDIFSTGVFFGYYKLDTGITWAEQSSVTAIKLVEWPLLMYGRYNSNTEAAENLLDGSEWQRLIDAPAYLGYRGKVPAVGRVDSGISGYESYSKAVKGVVAGIVQSATLSGTSLQLGKSPTLATIVGQTVKLKFGNGCLVSGVITDLGGGEYGINTSGMTLNVAWDTIDIKNVGTLAPGTPLDTTFKPNEIVLDTALLTRVPSPTMYLKSPGNIEFYLAGVQTSATPLYVKMTGIVDETTKTLSIEDFVDPANPTWPRTGVNVNFDAVQQSTNFTGDDAHFNYANWLASQNYTLHFSNKTFLLADIQKEGMPWELIVTPHVNSFVALPYVYYVRMVGDTTIMEDSNQLPAIFYDNGKTLVTVPASSISSIVYNNTDYSMVNLCKITLTARPSDVNAEYDNNFLYVDTWPPKHSAEVISYILQQGGMPTTMLGESLTSVLETGNPIGVEIKDETWTELLDSVMFESGLLLYSVIGIYHVATSFNRAKVMTFNRGATTDTFQRVQTQADIPFGDVIDGTYKFDIGRTLTNVDANGREFVRVHYTLKYKASSYKGEQLRTLRSTKAAKDNDRIIEYTFKHVADTLTCIAASTQITRAGHPANIPETTRKVTFGLPYKYIYLQALDVVTLSDFRHLTRQGDPLAAYDPASASNPIYTIGQLGVYARYNQTVPYMLIPGVCVIDSIRYDFSQTDTPITVSVKQTQPATTSNLKDVAVALTVNTDVDNADADAEAPEDADPNIPNNQYVCPEGDLVNVIITPGEPSTSSPTTNDPCCSSTTSEATVYGDPRVTIICVCSGCGEDGDQWPDSCFAPYDIYAEEGDTEIGNTLPVEIPIWLVALNNNVAVGLRSITYDGIGQVPGSCVQFAPGDMASVPGYGVRLGKVLVYPCAFNAPEGMYNKTIFIEFGVLKCTIFNNNPLTIYWPTVFETKVVSVDVSLKPVSDITIS